MKVIFERDGFRVLQNRDDGAITIETFVSPRKDASVRQHLPAEAAMAMTAAVNTACFEHQQTARVG